MTRGVWLAIVLVVAAGAGGLWWWSHGQPAPIVWQGYAEADFVKVGPTQPGLLTAVDVARGDTVAAGALLFTQDETADRAARDQAAQQLTQAEQQLANLRQPAKPTEIQQAEANLADANATLVRVAADLDRSEFLVTKGYATKQSVDQLRADYRSARAKVEGLTAALAQARAPTGREAEIAAQVAAVSASREALKMADWRLAQRRVEAPAGGRVADVLARPGETMAAGEPVVSLLPPENIFVRFFVPETVLGALHQGDPVVLACDGCRARLSATISFISPQAEFTPPLIYSELSKSKLVFMIEARPPPDQACTAQSWATGRGAARRNAGAMNGDLVIDVRDLHKSYGARRVVDGLTLQVKAGEICGFLGANGSGKTTTIRMLCGLVKPDGGGGTCLGLDILRDAPRIRLQVGYMTQRFSFYDDLTVYENLDFVGAVYDLANRRDAVSAIIGRMGLADRTDQLAGQLSGGWKQRLALAACVLHRPKLLLLDEPTAGVDALARREFWDLIHDMAADGLTVLVSTHYMDEAERCARIVYLSDGRLVVQGTPDAVAKDGGLVVFEATGPDLDVAARALRDVPGVEAAAVFGLVMRVAGLDRVALERAIGSTRGLVWREVEPKLEDVFIHLLSQKAGATS